MLSGVENEKGNVQKTIRTRDDQDNRNHVFCHRVFLARCLKLSHHVSAFFHT
jgi:hypothetical protein